MTERRIDILITAQDRTAAAINAAKQQLKNLNRDAQAAATAGRYNLADSLSAVAAKRQQQLQQLQNAQAFKSSKTRVWEMNASPAQMELREARRTYIEQSAAYRGNQEMMTQFAREYAARRAAIARREAAMTSVAGGVGGMGGGGYTAEDRMKKMLGRSGGKFAVIMGLEKAIPILAGLKASMMAIHAIQDSWNISLLKSTGQFGKAAEETLKWRDRIAQIPVLGDYINTLLVQMWHNQEEMVNATKDWAEASKEVLTIEKDLKRQMRQRGMSETEKAKDNANEDRKSIKATLETDRQKATNLLHQYEKELGKKGIDNTRKGELLAGIGTQKAEIERINRDLGLNETNYAQIVQDIDKQQADKKNEEMVEKAKADAATLQDLYNQRESTRIEGMEDGPAKQAAQAQHDYEIEMQKATSLAQKKALKEILDLKLFNIAVAAQKERQEQAKVAAEKLQGYKDQYKDLQIAGMDDKGGQRKRAEIETKYERMARGATDEEKVWIEKSKQQEIGNLDATLAKESADKRKQLSATLANLMIEGIADPAKRAQAELERDILAMRQNAGTDADPGVVNAIEQQMRSNAAMRQEQPQNRPYALAARESRFMVGGTDVPPWVAEQKKTAEQNNKLVRDGNQLLRDIKELLSSSETVPANLG